MKRWRCPDCGAVHTTRPYQYCPGVQYPKKLQQMSISAKLAGKTFLKLIPRQVQQHWLKIFHRICRRTANWPDPDTVLQDFVRCDQFPLTKRRIYSANVPQSEDPYLTFALTTKPPHFSLE